MSQTPSSETPGASINEADWPTDTVPPEEPTLAAEYEQLQQRLQALEETLLRERAEAENQRKRAQREYEQARKFGVERLLGELCAVIDNLQRGLDAARQNASVDRLQEGVEMTLKQLLKVAEGHGLSVIDPAGQAYVADQHEVLSMQPGTGQPAGTVVAVFERGYRLHERVLRTAKVVVAQG